ncbi:MAG TPA: glycosyl hydrolase family 18 protein [Acidobacteriaceae bacterium]|nr:glycosyl hydrolase family 18 protein [Acidobacteriaceae bacterium]
MSGCGGTKKAVVAVPPPAATAPTLAVSSSQSCPPAKQAFPLNPNPRLVEYFFLDKGEHYADYAKQVNFGKMTHLNLAFGDPPKCNGVCTANSDMAFSISGQSDADIAAIVAAAHAAGVKVILSIGGGGGDQRIIQFYNAGLSAELVNSLDKFVAAHGFDGIDLDIEDPSNMGAPFGTFVNALMAKFHPEGKIVTAAVAKYLQSSMPNASLHQFDFINVMVYSSYDQALDSLQFYSVDEKIARDKIVLGVGFFGSTADDSKEESYQKILAAYPNAWKVDLVGGGSLDDGQAFRYAGEVTMARETRLGEQYGGVMLWSILGDAASPHSLLTIIQNNLNTNPGAQAAGNP